MPPAVGRRLADVPRRDAVSAGHRLGATNMRGSRKTSHSGSAVQTALSHEGGKANNVVTSSRPALAPGGDRLAGRLGGVSAGCASPRVSGGRVSASNAKLARVPNSRRSGRPSHRTARAPDVRNGKTRAATVYPWCGGSSRSRSSGAVRCVSGSGRRPSGRRPRRSLRRLATKERARPPRRGGSPNPPFPHRKKRGRACGFPHSKKWLRAGRVSQPL